MSASLGSAILRLKIYDKTGSRSVTRITKVAIFVVSEPCCAGLIESRLGTVPSCVKGSGQGCGASCTGRLFISG